MKSTLQPGAVVLLALGAMIALAAIVPAPVPAFAQQPQQDQSKLYVCSMHPYETSHEAGSCTICGMALSEVEGYKPGSPIPDEDELFVNPDKPMMISAIAHKNWIPITKSPYYQPRKDEAMSGHDGMDHSGHMIQSMPDKLYVCSMHPYETAHEEGKCGICGMALSKVQGYEAGDAMPTAEELYVNPEQPMEISVKHHPGWVPMTRSPYYQPKTDK